MFIPKYYVCLSKAFFFLIEKEIFSLLIMFDPYKGSDHGVVFQSLDLEKYHLGGHVCLKRPQLLLILNVY